MPDSSVKLEMAARPTLEIPKLEMLHANDDNSIRVNLLSDLVNRRPSSLSDSSEEFPAEIDQPSVKFSSENFMSLNALDRLVRQADVPSTVRAYRDISPGKIEINMSQVKVPKATERAHRNPTMENEEELTLLHFE